MTSAEASLKSRATRRVFIAIAQRKSGRLKQTIRAVGAEEIINPNRKWVG
jgi:hypothetical protein